MTVAAGGGYLRAAAVLALRLREVGATRPLLVLVPQFRSVAAPAPGDQRLASCSLRVLEALKAIVRPVPLIADGLLAAGPDAVTSG